MYINPIFISNMTAIAFFITGILANSEQASATQQEQFNELEATKVLMQESSNKTVADVMKDINEDKLNCTAIVSSEGIRTGRSILFNAFLYNQQDIAKACISQCIRLNTCLKKLDDEDRTILHRAAKSTPELLKMVLDNVPGSHTLLNQTGSNGDVPLMQALEASSPDNIRILKDAGANVNVKNRINMTLLEMAKTKIPQTIRQNDTIGQKKVEEIIKILSPGPTEKL